MMLAKADLHVHSIYSERPSEWFLQKLGANESYTEPESIYQKSKEHGMSFVTVTDHNRIEGAILLKGRHPDEVITGVESTVYFPEDEQAVHLLIYGLSEDEFQEVQRLRKDIYQLRDYLLERRLAHSVAHATFSVNRKITMEHLEKLLLLFDVFESINGGRSSIHNMTWTRVLESLTPEHIDSLFEKHRIEPCSDMPWVKGLTGGSDDHAGIFMGTSYTLAEATDADSFLDSMRMKQTMAGGRHNDYQSLAVSVYKVVYDFSMSRSDGEPRSPWIQASQMLFDQKGLSRLKRLQLRLIRTLRPKLRRGPSGHLLELLERLQRKRSLPLEDKVDVVYEQMAQVSDAFAEILAQSLEHDLVTGDVVGLVSKISSVIPGIFVSLPFLTTLRHMYRGRDLLNELESRFLDKQPPRPRRLLWFEDILADNHDIRPQLEKLRWLSDVSDREISLATSLSDGIHDSGWADAMLINLPFAYQTVPLGPREYTFKIPSILHSLQDLSMFEPDEVYLPTAGPVGLFGLLVSKLLNARSIGVYDERFSESLLEIVGGEAVEHLAEGYVKWFYSAADELRLFGEQPAAILEPPRYEPHGRISLRGKASRESAALDLIRESAS